MWVQPGGGERDKTEQGLLQAQCVEMGRAPGGVRRTEERLLWAGRGIK